MATVIFCQTARAAVAVESTLSVSSPGFSSGARIPKQFTADGANVSPPLFWQGVPNRTASLALICQDPDAPRGTWIHWVVFNIPPRQTMITQGAKAVGQEGTNSFQKRGYGGPEPPPGKTHRYYFQVFALDSRIQLPSGASASDLEGQMQGHVLAKGYIMGTYAR